MGWKCCTTGGGKTLPRTVNLASTTARPSATRSAQNTERFERPLTPEISRRREATNGWIEQLGCNAQVSDGNRNTKTDNPERQEQTGARACDSAGVERPMAHCEDVRPCALCAGATRPVALA